MEEQLQNPAAEIPKKQYKWLKTLVAVVVLILIGGGGFLAGKYVYEPRRSVAPEVVYSNLIPSPSPVDEMANWKTYVNIKSGYSLKYPNNFSVDETTGRPGFVNLYDSTEISPEARTRNIRIEVFDNPKNLSATDFVKNNFNQDLLKQATQVRISINGVNSVELLNAPGTPGYHINFYVPYKGKVFSLGLDVASSSSEFISTFNKIVSTFEVPAREQDTSNWKTYTGKSFYFKYPFDWQVTSKDTELPYVTFGPIIENPSGASYITYLTLFTNRTDSIDLSSLQKCSESSFPCMAGQLMNKPLGGKSAVTADVAYGIEDADFKIIQTVQNPFVQLKMNVSGGGLANTFEQILLTFKFTN